MAIEKPKQSIITLVPPLDHEEEMWLKAHGDPRSDDYEYEDDIPSELDVTISRDTPEKSDDYYRDLEEEHRRLGGVAAKAGFRVIKGGRR